ncbi:MAG: extracellular solute-binding protein [Candidatus Wildermuthbacteria bacterium]|nr:extracellular solute-binding protein [Candidatus Wildermuthbacteria bacterium]
MKRILVLGMVVMVVFLILSACAPAVVPTPAPVARQPAVAPTTLVALSPEETEWQKVVAAAKKEGKVTIYSWALTGDINIKVREAFRNRTGLDIEILTGTGAPLIERIKAERRGGFQIASVLDTSVVLLYQAKLEGLTQTVGYLPNVADQTAWQKSPQIDPEANLLAVGRGWQSPWVNTKLLKPGEEPRSWKELLQPQWKGKIDFPDPDITPTPVRVFYYLAKHGLNEAYFREIAKQVVFSPTNRLSAERLARGEVSVAFVQSTVAMAPFAIEGAPVKAIDMEEGVIAMQSPGIALVDRAPHLNAARVYINWLLSQEGQTVYHKLSGTSSFRKDVPSFEPPSAQLSPKRTIWATPEGELEVAKIQRDKVLKRLMEK